MDPLEEYTKKRKFDITPEPKPEVKPGVNDLFTVQKHTAKRAGLHYDWRFAKDGVAKSFVTRKIPTAKKKTLFVPTEDHPIDYMKWEGEIPEGEYGAGKVELFTSGSQKIEVWTDVHIILDLKSDKITGLLQLIRIANGWLGWLI